MSSKKVRRARSGGLVKRVTPLSELAIAPRNAQADEREDGAKSSLQLRLPRKRKGSTEPIKLSTVGWIAAAACFGGLWDLADQIDALYPPTCGPGRRRQVKTVEVLLFEMASWECLTFRKADRELRDPHMWEVIRDAVAAAYPDRPERRLSEVGPSRGQHSRFRDRYLKNPEAVAWLGDVCDSLMAQVAVTIGCGAEGVGSLTHPHASSTIVGDASWIGAMFNAPPGVFGVDPETGELVEYAHDPDSLAYHRGDTAPGRNFLSVLGGTGHAKENLMLACSFIDRDDEASTFVKLAVQSKERLRGIQVAAYDMAIGSAYYDALLSAGIIPVIKVPRKNGQLAAAILGEETFTFRNGQTEEVLVHTVDGAPGIHVVADGEKCFVALTRKQNKFRHGAHGFTLYTRQVVPDEPGVPQRLRGATVWIRHNSSPEEIGRNRRRTIYLRPLPEIDDDFKRLFGRRELTESTHNHIKERTRNRRARCVGLDRQMINMRAYQLRSAIVTLMAWHRRTESDISTHFGNWRPPGSAQLAAAA